MKIHTGTNLGSTQRVLSIRQSLLDANRTEQKPLSRGTPPKTREQMLKEAEEAMPPMRRETAWIKWLWKNGYTTKEIAFMTGCSYTRIGGIASGRAGKTVEPLRPEHLVDASGQCKEAKRD